MSCGIKFRAFVYRRSTSLTLTEFNMKESYQFVNASHNSVHSTQTRRIQQQNENAHENTIEHPQQIEDSLCDFEPN